MGILILVEGFDHGPAGSPDPAPVPDDRCTPEERWLNARRIEPAHVVRRVYALEVNRTAIIALHAGDRALCAAGGPMTLPNPKARRDSDP